jgi:xanthosine utilization system XapX-like protein
VFALLTYLASPVLPSPEIISGWEQVGIVGILVGGITGFLWLLLTERLVTGARFREMKDRERTGEDERRQMQSDFVRLTEAYERLGRDLIGYATGSGYGDRYREGGRRSDERG